MSIAGANAGTADAEITQIQVNGIPITCNGNQLESKTTAGNSFSGYGLPIVIPSSGSYSISFLIGTGGCNTAGENFAGGQTLQVAVITSAGNVYPASVVLPGYALYEKIGIATQYSVTNRCTTNCPPSGGWVLIIGGQNTGTADATIMQIQINGVPYPLNPANAQSSTFTSFSSGQDQIYYMASGIGSGLSPTSSANLYVPSGASFSIHLALDSNTISGRSFASGQTIQVTVITAAGNNYPASIVLP
ncbi:MAG: hypothetical protein QXX17_08260 [Conexivisphaerales archaeon]